ncbi:MAG: acetyl-CoA carboxylase biotin carboxyl carrier protein [Planctomycetota bacterium]|jgi:acetyl-CoA carboxylase biotin carboxyl carrier protein
MNTSSDSSRVALRVSRDEAGIRLLAPHAGVFTCAHARGAALAPGQGAGTMLVLGRACELFVPEGVHGIVTSARPERVHAPVSYEDVLYELSALTTDGIEFERAEVTHDAEEGLVLRSPQAGRFYHRPSPDVDPLTTVGSELQVGSPVGLIEVMKTFTHVPYQAHGGLPERARVVKILAADGADIAAGDGLIVVEPI